MNLKRALHLSLGLSACALGACGGNGTPDASLAPVPISQSVNTAQVLSLARKSSETASPFAVDGGLITFTDTSENTQAAVINGQ